jgi:hypothetical protein
MKVSLDPNEAWIMFHMMYADKTASTGDYDFSWFQLNPKIGLFLKSLDSNVGKSSSQEVTVTSYIPFLDELITGADDGRISKCSAWDTRLITSSSDSIFRLRCDVEHLTDLNLKLYASAE